MPICYAKYPPCRLGQGGKELTLITVLLCGAYHHDNAGNTACSKHRKCIQGIWYKGVGHPERNRARSTRRKSNTAAEILPEGWHHAGVRPAPHVTLPDWLLDEPDKVAHRDYSTGFYYPEHKVRQSTDRSAYFRAWLVVGEVLSWTPEDGGRVTIMSRNKIEAGQEVEFVLPGAAPFAYTVPAGGFRDADGHWVEAINNPAHVFSMPCPQEVPVNAAIRSRTKKPTLKAE